MTSTRKRAPARRPAQPPARKDTQAEQAGPAEAPPPNDSQNSERQEAVRAGGFHESSYELKNGLEVSESEWPTETTIPGPLGER